MRVPVLTKVLEGTPTGRGIVRPGAHRTTTSRGTAPSPLADEARDPRCTWQKLAFDCVAKDAFCALPGCGCELLDSNGALLRSRSVCLADGDHLRSESNASARLDDGHQGTPPRTRERREKDKKTMLSRALQKANTAVLLDNAQNFEGAMEAYEDACKLLQQVMIRSSQEEDRRKLDAIVSYA